MIKVGIIGTGKIAHEYMKVISSISTCDVVGVVGRNFEKAATFATKNKIGQAYKSINDLYNSCKPDCVIICVSVEQIFNVTIHAINFDWYILLEKPLGLNLQESMVLQEKIKRSKTNVYVALNRRNYFVTNYVKQKIIHSRGNRFVSVQDQQNLLALESEGFDKKVIENWMFANSIHLIDYITVFCRGQLIDIQRHGNYRGKEPSTFTVFLAFESGDTAIYNAHWNKPAPWEVSVATTDYFWNFKPLENCQEYSQKSGTFRNIDSDAFDKNFKPGFYRQFKSFLNLVSEKILLPTDLATFEDAHETMLLVDKIYA